MMNKDIQEKLTAFKYALEQEITKSGTPCRVYVQDHPESSNKKYSFIKSVVVQYHQGIKNFTIWASNKGEIFWEEELFGGF